MNNILANILRFLLLIVLQVFVCNAINLFGFATPALYIMALMLLPFELPKAVQYLIGFFTGLVVDMFCHTLGVNSFACVVMMFVRPYLVRLLNGRKTTEGVERPIPGVKDFKWIAMYVLILSTIHQFFVVLLETCSFANFGHTLFAMLCNMLFTVFVILCVEYIFFPIKRNS